MAWFRCAVSAESHALLAEWKERDGVIGRVCHFHTVRRESGVSSACVVRPLIGFPPSCRYSHRRLAPLILAIAEVTHIWRSLRHYYCENAVAKLQTMEL